MAPFRLKLFTEILIIYIFICSAAVTGAADDVSGRNASTVNISEVVQASEMATKKIYAVDFEVFGRVQGVFFRKHTERQAKQLGVYGWCMNTNHGTVRGQIEGNSYAITEMKDWLQHRGSPKSRIDRANFTDMKEVPTYTFKSFSIKR